MADGPANPFGSDPQTVLEALTAKLGAAPRLSLKDESSGPGHAPVLKPAPSDSRAPLPKGRGNYHLLGELARGGMGVVIKGHDTDLGRDVALKVLHEELSEDPAIVSRFVEEAQIGGQLQHPGIVPVYELGLLEDDRPFFTMKLVKGRTLSNLLKQRRELAEDRRRFLTIFEQVCQTVAYAHNRDVVHRDLKPSNVMVGAFGEVQVVDWGLAKVLRRTDDPEATHSAGTAYSTIETVRSGSDTPTADSVAGAIMGTPAYMPPEQARGELDDLAETADVFSLGGILCEILTGKAPYHGPKQRALALASSADQGELEERLSQCSADRELVDLAGECLAPDPLDRPRNAGVVAERMTAHLASLEERARRAEVRAARTLGLSASVVVTLIVAAGAWIWTAAERGRVDREEANRERTELEQRAERRRETENLVSAALSEAAFARAREDWNEAHSAVERSRAYLESEPDPDLALRVEKEVERQAAAETLADEERERAARLAQFIEGLEKSRGDLVLVSNAAYRISAYEQAFVDFGIDLTFLSEQEVVSASQRSGRPADIARALDDLSRFHSAVVSGKSPRLLGFAMAMDTDPVRNAIREAVQQKNETGILEIAKQEEAREPDGTTALSLATALHPVRECDRSIRILTNAARRHPDDFSVRAVLGELLLDRDPTQALLHLSVAEGLQPMSPYVLQLLGRVHRRLGNQALALDCSRRAVDLHPSEPQARIHLGLALRDTGDDAGSAESLAVAEELDPGCLEEYVRIHVRISRDARSEGYFDQAEWYARRAADVGTESAPAHFWLGLALNDQGKNDEAIESFRRAIEINPTHGEASNSLAASLRNAGRIDEAIESYRRQITITPNHLFAHVGLGIVLADKGLYEEAIESIQRQVDLRPRHPHLRLNLAWVYFHAGAFDAALESYDKAMQLDPDYCYAHHTMTFFFAHAPEPEFRDAEEAVRLGERAVELHVGAPTYGAAHTLTLEWEMLGQAYYRAGRFEDCVEALEKSIELAVRGAEATHTLFLAMAHKQLGHDGEAREHYDAAVNWMESHELNVTDGSDLMRWREEARAVLDG